MMPNLTTIPPRGTPSKRCSYHGCSKIARIALTTYRNPAKPWQLFFCEECVVKYTASPKGKVA